MLLFLILALAAPARAGEALQRPRLCPEGVRLPPRPGCGSRETAGARREDGLRDLGNGTSLRIGGRAGAVYDTRR
ncbi:hypothetical protein [uncultured Methylobacterium sp.]|uniref:hypothetical protein n=1 Tax=uncultured Methylobacterium sp. TaxID=157278 RepID=UPI0035C956F6